MEASLQHRPKQPFHGSLGRCCFGNSMLMIPQEVTAWPTNNDGSKMLTDKEGTEKGAYLAVLCKMYDINENGNYTMHYPKTAVSLCYFLQQSSFLPQASPFLQASPSLQDSFFLHLASSLDFTTVA